MTTGNDCSACGFSNPLGANFCSSCGAAITATAEHRTEAIEPTLTEGEIPASDLPPGLGMLIVRQGSKRGSRMALDTDLVAIGRHPDSDIFLDDITVSRRHAEVRSTANGHEVRDLGSLNGTYVNQERVDAAPLTDGDELRVGKFKLVYVALGDEADHER